MCLIFVITRTSRPETSDQHHYGTVGRRKKICERVETFFRGWFPETGSSIHSGPYSPLSCHPPSCTSRFDTRPSFDYEHTTGAAENFIGGSDCTDDDGSDAATLIEHEEA
jgi:hypothetical protein